MNVDTTIAATAPEALAGVRVAVVEDDAELLALMVADLCERGIECTGLGSAEALYRHLATHACDIVVLDVGLPGEDGYSVARYLRQTSAIGILMLTGRGAARDMLRGLEGGADLYLVKPLDLDVLAAGLHSLHRRLAQAVAAGEEAQATAAAPWALAGDGWSLRAPNGQLLALTESERAFLQPLFASPAVPVDRDTLIAGMTDAPWDFDPHRLEVLVHRLRARASAAGMQLPVRAVRGTGYLLVPGEG